MCVHFVQLQCVNSLRKFQLRIVNVKLTFLFELSCLAARKFLVRFSEEARCSSKNETRVVIFASWIDARSTLACASLAKSSKLLLPLSRNELKIADFCFEMWLMARGCKHETIGIVLISIQYRKDIIHYFAISLGKSYWQHAKICPWVRALFHFHKSLQETFDTSRCGCSSAHNRNSSNRYLFLGRTWYSFGCCADTSLRSWLVNEPTFTTALRQVHKLNTGTHRSLLYLILVSFIQFQQRSYF